MVFSPGVIEVPHLSRCKDHVKEIQAKGDNEGDRKRLLLIAFLHVMPPMTLGRFQNREECEQERIKWERP
jgi:hypothetical protein